MLERLLAAFPTVEVAGRLAYWRLSWMHRLGNAVRDWRARKGRKPAEHGPASADFSEVVAAIHALGVESGDILIVHSSFAALKPYGLSAEEIIARLREAIGPGGTLAMPTIPIFRGEPQGLDRHKDSAFDRWFDYDVSSTRIWTGALPKALMQMPGAVRSRCPGNPMAAIGPHAEAMMRDNLAGEQPSPSGPGSAWEYCYRHGAKIIALGIDLVHSLTMIHVAEESFPERWQIEDWYRPRRYHVKDGDFQADVTLMERRHGWSQFYAERAFSKDLFGSGVATARTIDGLSISYCEARRLVDFLVSHPRPFYPYVFPFGFSSAGKRP